MSEHLPSFEDDQAAVEYALLWDDVQDLFRRNVGALGIRMASLEFGYGRERTKMVLSSVPEDELIIQAWALPTEENLIGQVTVSYQDGYTHSEDFMYELRPDAITYYGNEDKRTSFDKEEIEELRADLLEAVWDAEASEDAALNTPFLGA